MSAVEDSVANQRLDCELADGGGVATSAAFRDIAAAHKNERKAQIGFMASVNLPVQFGIGQEETKKSQARQFPLKVSK
jgi:hypothetical protein